MNIYGLFNFFYSYSSSSLLRTRKENGKLLAMVSAVKFRIFAGHNVLVVQITGVIVLAELYMSTCVFIWLTIRSGYYL